MAKIIILKCYLMLAIVLFYSPLSTAHRYFFGLSELTINPENQHLEVIHSLTAHDVATEIGLTHQIKLTPANPKFEQYIQSYVAEKFKISYKNQIVKLDFIGAEINRDKILIFQESKKQKFLSGLLVKNDLLVDTYAKQINTLNYQSSAINGSLTFDTNHRILEIK